MLALIFDKKVLVQLPAIRGEDRNTEGCGGSGIHTRVCLTWSPVLSTTAQCLHVQSRHSAEYTFSEVTRLEQVKIPLSEASLR